MKSLILMRHAKSDWSADFNKDFDRPLNKRGMKAAAQMGRFLLRAGNIPDLILTSPAVRALHTAQLVMETLGKGITMVKEPQLYESTVSTSLEVFRKISNDHSKILVVGHNPTLEETVSILCTGSPDMNIRMPTAAIAYLNLDISDWQTLDSGRARLGWLINPKSIPDIP